LETLTEQAGPDVNLTRLSQVVEQRKQQQNTLVLVVKVAPESAMKFLCYDVYKNLIIQDPENPTILERFCAGFVVHRNSARHTFVRIVPSHLYHPTCQSARLYLECNLAKPHSSQPNVTLTTTELHADHSQTSR
jgi:hypothetical protein